MLARNPQGGQSWLGKAIVAVLFGFLIVSFAIWGIGDIFRGVGADDVATVGKTDISVEQFRTAYQNELQRLKRQTRQSITPERRAPRPRPAGAQPARDRGGARPARPSDCGLRVSDAARRPHHHATTRTSGAPTASSTAPPSTRSCARTAFSEAAFVREQRGVVARLQLAEAHRRRPPRAARRAGRRMHRYATSAARRLTSAVAGGCGRHPRADRGAAPDLFRGAQGAFRAPEYRAVNAAGRSTRRHSPGRSDVSDADARPALRAVKARATARPSGGPSSRSSSRRRGGRGRLQARSRTARAFEAIAAERNIAPRSLELGTFTRTECSIRRWRTPPSPSQRGRRERTGRRAASAPCSCASPRSSRRASSPSSRSRPT